MKKFLPAIFFAVLLFPFSTLPSLAGCSPITSAGCAGGSYCSASRLCCTLASDCTVPLTNTTTVAEDAACKAAGISPETCAAINTLFTSQPDGPWYNQNPSQFANKVLGGDQSEIFGERYTYAQINWIINSIATMLNPAANIRSATDLFNFIVAIEKVIKDTTSGQRTTIQDYAKIGPAGLFVGGMSALYSNPPASGVNEIKTLASKIFDLGTGTKPALAQGYGFNGLGGNTGGAIRALWTASRNMSYLIMIILLIASGFLIMFRVKINPQTVVSLQTMIPKLIITMLLVTFSFAIAGLVIDLIYVFIVAIVGMLSVGGAGAIIDQPITTINWLTGSNFISYAVLQSATSIFASLIALILLSFIPVVGSVVGVIIVIVVVVFWLITLLKIFWMLLKAYVMLILQITIAPLQIMLDLIPGQQGFGPWLRNYIANASVFVVVPIMFIIQHILSWDLIANIGLGIKALGPTQTNGLGDVTLGLPLLGGNALAWWNVLTRFGIGFVIFTMTPKIADIIRDILKIPPFKYGSAIGESINFITKPVGGTLSSMGADISKNAKGPAGHVIGGTLQGVGGGISSFKT